MSFLPDATNATIADSKIKDYLLDPSHPIGGPKAKFFNSLGFSDAELLKRALLEHPKINRVVSQRSTKWGDNYVVTCSLITPDGKNPCITSVWAVEPPNPEPKFVTAYPNP